MAAILTYSDRHVDAHLLGKIMLARFLALPLRSVHRLLVQTEAAIGPVGLAQCVSAGRLPGVLVDEAPTQMGAAHLASALVKVINVGEKLHLVYLRESSVREYRFDEDRLRQLIAQSPCPAAIATVVRKLRLINTRNRLTHALVTASVQLQHAYVASGDIMRLVPLTQETVSAHLRTDPTLSVVADAGRVSRLTRTLSIALSSQQVVSLGTLLPKPRKIYQNYVDYIIREERNRLICGELRKPLSDNDIVSILMHKYGANVLRRTVASIRQDLGIPDCRSRYQRMDYLVATAGFSTLVPLNAQTLRNVVPPSAGVYEIRAREPASSARPDAGGWQAEATGQIRSGIIYIGSSIDLRKRLGEHLRGNSDNMLLHELIVEGAARVRFCLVSEAGRAVERRLYNVFCDTFGSPPTCNRMSP
ncbi:hypothetical protein NDK50_15055 [Paraburkholderia bryophila]|uniref:RNA polymerase factor sigma-54 n=1 Tax=Paraburkholderia bryophila TaxID=420952 RepID=UPI002349FE81|nr:hypothetical protein [Paraburkholderia bryophila]WCM18750.1 hypothetical protein NDK50_15055 [Paraburkholderia bryophila]